ncbi:MAG: hypothetical protein AB7O92_12205 [Acidimicrobiia bacterium]
MVVPAPEATAMVPVVQPAPQPEPPDIDPPASDTGPRFGLLASGDLVANFAGQTWTLTAAQLAQAEIAIGALPQPLPGLRFESATYGEKTLTINAAVDVPGLDETAIKVKVNRKGEAKISGRATQRFSLPAIGDASVTLEYSDDRGVTGTATLTGAAFSPTGVPGLKVDGGGEVTLSAGKLSGNGTVRLTYADLGTGTLNFSFADAGFTADGSVHLKPPFLGPIDVQLSLDPDGNITAEAVVELTTSTPAIRQLALEGGTLTVRYLNGVPSLDVADFRASYAGLGTISIPHLGLNNRVQPEGEGTFVATIPMLTEASGTVKVSRGRISGSLTLGKDNFPEGLPIRSGTITAKLTEDGSLSLSGKMTADFGPAGKADLAAEFGEQGFVISGSADLTIPGLTAVHLTASYRDGDLAGEAQVPVDATLLPGLTGNVTVRFSEGRWSGETTLQYSADDGKLSGTVTITVDQVENGSIAVGGSGAVTAQLMPGLQGTLTATILPEGAVDVSGQIVVTEPYSLFSELRTDKELVNYSQSIPLWAILVAVIRVRAGVRAGIGPGVFRNIQITGSYTVGSEEGDPSFSITGEMYIPAFAEAYVAFGAGLGLDVVLGSLTGGIEGVATAGIYGAISVVPELSYENGDWAIDGVATLAAGARLKVGLNAWAEVEAAWITVWENTWRLAEYVMPLGADLGLQARLHYVFGQPAAPEFELQSSDIDTEKLITEAMPEDGPPAAGAREALQNKADWKGKLKEQRDLPVPPEQVAQATAPATPPAAPPRPPKPPTSPSARGAAPPEDTGTSGGTGPTPAQAGAADRNAQAAAKPDPAAAKIVPEGELPASDQPRYPTGISLAMLEEPPVGPVRSVTQANEDLAAAKRLVELASNQAANSDSLDDYFPRIKNRFRLTSLGYEGDFDKGFKVVGSINPQIAIEVHEPLTGTGLDQGLGRKTSIVHGSTNLGGDSVGVTMTAMPLGPDHPAGSGPSGQSTLMKQLPSDPSKFRDANSRFVRGHLLNDWLGGEGVARNLFPLTAHANTLHSSGIEESVKDWTNTRKFWVKYEVKITIGKVDLVGPEDDNYVNATLSAAACVLDTNLDPVPSLTRQVVVESTFLQPATLNLQAAVDEAERLDAHQAVARQERPQDQAVVALGTTRQSQAPSIPVFPQSLEDALKSTINRMGKEKLKSRLLEEPGWGPVYTDVLWKAYEFIKLKDDNTLTNLDADEARNFRSMVTLWEKASSPLIHL